MFQIKNSYIKNMLQIKIHTYFKPSNKNLDYFINEIKSLIEELMSLRTKLNFDLIN